MNSKKSEDLQDDVRNIFAEFFLSQAEEEKDAAILTESHVSMGAHQ